MTAFQTCPTVCNADLASDLMSSVAIVDLTNVTDRVCNGVLFLTDDAGLNDAAVALSGGNKYVVRNGDNPWLIARRFKVKLSDLLKANGLNSKSMLKVGQTLVIPNGTVTAPAVVTSVNKPVEKKEESLDSLLDSVDTPETPANKPAATPKVIEEKAVAPVVPAPAPKAKDADEDLGFGKQIETISDTTVARLAAKYNTTVEKLQLLNPTIPEDGNIKKGTLIQLPK